MRRAIKPALIAVSILIAGIFLKGSIPQPATGTWLGAGSMAAPRAGAASALLHDGRILITGGDSGSGPDASAEIFDSTGAFISAPPMSIARSAHTATVLADGRVLVAGGSIGAAATNAAEIFDPLLNAWTTVAGGMIQARSNHTASLLPDGRVLFAGGDSAGTATASLEIFDPMAGSFSSAGVMSAPRTSFSSAVLSNGQVLLVGGSSGASNGNTPLATTEIFDPVNNSVTAGPALSAPRTNHSATTLLNGQVLVAGGTGVVTNPDNSTSSVDLASAEIFDPAAGTFTTSPSTLGTARSGHLAFLLPHNNNVLIVGGTSAGAPIATAEFFTPWLGTFSSTGAMASARSNATGIALQQDGLLIVAGGKNASGAALSSSELYGFATIKTDKADYPPGSVVTISGSGWQPGETVTLTLVESPLIDTHGPFNVVADSAGNISNNSFITDLHDLNITFSLTAVGSVSQAQMTFTDANDNTSTSVACLSTSLLVGGSTTCTATVKDIGGSNGSPTGTVSWTIAPVDGNFSPSTCTLVTGSNSTSTCSATLNATAAGSPTITASYPGGGSGNTQWKLSSGNLAVTISKRTTTTAVALNSPVVVGQASTAQVTVTDTDTGTPTNPTGTVTLASSDTGDTFGICTLVPSGGNAATCSASVTPSKIGSSPHTITATFPGDTSHATSNGSASLVVNQAGTTTSLSRTSGVSPSVFGQSLTFTATVTAVVPGTGTPTGTVTFKDGVANLATVNLTGNTAALTTTTLAVGGHSITATYNADVNYAGSTSSSVAQTVNQASTTTTITNAASLNTTPSVVGQAVTMNVSVAPVSPGSGTPSGSVNVSDGSGDTCTATLAAGAGSCTITFPTAGAKTLSAVYAGDSNFTTSTSANAPHTVNAANTTTTITNGAALATASIVNQPYAVAYSVAITAPGGGAIPPTDTVTVTDGTDSCTANVAAGTCNLTSTTTGAKTITAKYNGDPNYSSSTSAGVAHTVGIAPAITSANNTSFTVNSAGTFTVTATGFPAPTFSETGALPGGVTLNSTTGVLSGTPALGSVGSYPITITASNGVGSDATQSFTLTVAKITPTFSALTASQSIPFGQASVGLSGRVNGYPMMTGTVTITIGAVNSPSLTLVGNPNNFSDAAFDTHTLSVSGSPYTITYAYSGDANSNSASDTSTTLTVAKVTPTVHWTAPAAITFNTALSGTQLNATFTAVVNGVTVPVPGTATYNPAAGTVLNAGAAQALGVNFVPTDSADYNNATGSVSITVNKAATSTAVVSNNNPSFSGQSVTFTATVSNTSGTPAVPTGSVQFFDGASPLGSPQTLVAGQAAVTTSALSVATHSITAVYSNGDGNFTGSTSSAISQVVKSADTTTSISAPTITYGANGLVTVTVAANDPSAGTPTGNVTLTVDSGAPLSQALVAGSTTFTISNPNAGDHPLAASYSAQNNFNASSALGNLHVNQAQATLAFGSLIFTYDGSPKPVTVTTTPLNLPGVSILYNGSPMPPTNAGSTPVSATLTNANYVATPISDTELIQQAAALVIVSDPMPTYDGTQKSANVQVSPMNLNVAVTYNGSPTMPTSAGSYAVVATVMDANYAGVGSGTLTIKQATLTVTANDKSRAYGTNNPPFDGTITGIVNNDPITATYSSSADQSSPVGTYDIVPTLSDNGSGTLPDYSVVSHNGTLTITAIPLYIVANDQSRIYGAADPSFTAQYFGFVNGDNPASFTGSLLCVSNSNATSSAGSYDIHCGGLSSTNYSVHFVDATLGIRDPLSTIAVTPNAPQVTYGVAQTFSAQGTFTSSMTRALGSAGGAVYELNASSLVRTGTAAAEADGKLYVIGGLASGTPSKIVEAYDPMTNAVPVAVASLAAPRSNARAISVAGRVYVIGGCSDVACATLASSAEVYDPPSNAWSGISTSGFTLRSSMALGVINGKIYAAGGNDSSGTALGTVEVYDPATDTWSTAPSMTVALGPASGGLMNGKFYVVGTSGGNAAIQVFDGTSWSAVNAPPQALADAAAAVLNNVLYVFDGSNVHAYDPVGNSWSNKASLTAARLQPQPVTIGNLIYVSENATAATSALESFATDEVNWSTSDSTVAPVDQTGKASAAKVGTAQITATAILAPSISGSTTMTVARATVTPNVSVSNKVYDGNNLATITTRSLTGVLNLDDVQLIGGTALFSDKNVGTAKTVTITGLSLGGGASANYQLSSTTASTTADITTAPLTATLTAADKFYDGTTVEPDASMSCTVATVFAGDTVNCAATGGTFNSKDVLTAYQVTATVTIGGTSAGNYTLGAAGTSTNSKSATATAHINPAPVTVIVSGGATFDGLMHSASIALSPSIAGYAVNYAGAITGYNSSIAPTNADTYTVTVTVTDSNYVLSGSGTGTFVINKAASSTTVNCPASVTYNGLAQTPCTVAVTGAGGLSTSVAPMYTNNTNAGTASASATYTGDANHTGSSGSTNFTINKAIAMISVVPYSVTYDGAPHAAMGTAKGVLNEPLSGLDLTGTVHIPAGVYTDAWVFTDVTGNYYNANGITTDTILMASTTTTLGSSLNPSNWGQVVILTATVANASTGAPPTGSVSFYNAAGGATCAIPLNSVLLDTEPLSTTSPYVASTSSPTLPVGTDSILACYNYNGADPNFNANFLPSYGSLNQTVIAAPIATLIPASGLSFGTQQGGTVSGAQTLYLCNGPSLPNCATAPVATAQLLVSGIAFTGTNPTYFTQTNTCGSSVAVGGSCAISVKFAPPAGTSGVASALLTVTDNNENQTGSTQSSPVIGAGVSSISSVGSLSTYAIFATANGCSSLNVSGNGTVDSFNSGASNNAGNVGTNGNATLSGNPVVNGAVYSPVASTGNCSTKTVTGLTTSGKAQATGGLQALSGPVTYPAPSAPKPAPPTTSQNISGSCPSGMTGCANAGSKTVNLAPGSYGNVSANGGTTVHVSAGTYNFNSLTLSGNSNLVVDSGPVVVSLAGTGLSNSSAAMDLGGGSMSNTSQGGRSSNLQIYYGGTQPIKLSGGVGSYAVVYAPNSPITVSGGAHFYGSIVGSTVNSSGNTAIHYDSSLPNIQGGDFIWFSSVGLNVQGLPAGNSSVKLYVTNASISFSSTQQQCTGTFDMNHGLCTLPVPNAVITFSSTASTSSTTWDATNNRWSTLVPISAMKGNATIHTFFDGLAYQVPSGGFPNGIQNVTWSAAFSTTLTGLSFNWQWGAAVYNPSFNSSYSSLGVNPIDGTDPAGTPESDKADLVFGATGAGYTGLNVGTAGVVPTIAPMSTSPSSLDFGTVTKSVTSPTMNAMLTNNDSVPYTINPSGISITGTNAADFAQTNDCPMGGVLAAGASCTFTVTFTPSLASKETAKIVINDSANNSPQTIFLKGTGQ